MTNNFPALPPEQPEYKGWKFVIVTVAVLVAGSFFVGGLFVGKCMADTYYVSSKGIVHNQECKFAKSIDDTNTKNCQYCGGADR